MGTSIVLFKDKAYNVDFGLLIPDYGGGFFVFVAVLSLILMMLKFCITSTMSIISNKRSHLAAFTMNCLTISKPFTLARNNFDPLRRVFVLCVVNHI